MEKITQRDSSPEIEVVQVKVEQTDSRTHQTDGSDVCDDHSPFVTMNLRSSEATAGVTVCDGGQQQQHFEIKRKLTLDEKVSLIRSSEQEPQMTQQDLADRFNISQPQVSRTLKRKEFLLSEWSSLERYRRIRRRTENATLLRSRQEDCTRQDAGSSWMVDHGSGAAVLYAATALPSAADFKTEVPDRMFGNSIERPMTTRDAILHRLRGYDPADVFMVVDCALYFRALPYTSGGNSTGSTVVSARDLVSVLACVSSKLERRQLLVSGRPPRPVTFRHLPVSYVGGSRRSSILPDEFEMWLWDWNEELRRADRKVALLVVSDSELSLSGVRFGQVEVVDVDDVSFLMAGACGEALLVGFKAAYRKLLVTRYVCARNDLPGANPAALAVTLLEACHLMAQAWCQTNLSAVEMFFSEAVPVLHRSLPEGDGDERRDRFRMSGCELAPPPLRMTARAWKAYLDVDRHVTDDDVEVSDENFVGDGGWNGPLDHGPDSESTTSADVVRALSTIGRYLDVNGLRTVVPALYELETLLLGAICDRTMETQSLADIFPK